MNTIDTATSVPVARRASLAGRGLTVPSDRRRAARTRTTTPTPASPAVATSWYQICPTAEMATPAGSMSRSSKPPTVFVSRGDSQILSTSHAE